MNELNILNPPLTATIAEAQAVVGPWQDGREAVLHYGDWAGEYAALDASAGLVDWSGRTQVEMTGADRADFLNRMATHQLDRLPPGSGREAFLTNPKGQIVAYLRVFATPQTLVLDTAAGQAGRILGHLSRYLIRERVELHDRSGAWCEFLLAGPRSGEVLLRLGVAPLPGEPLDHRAAELGGAAVWVRCLEPTRRTAFLVACENEAAVAVWRAVRDAGAAACGRMAAEALRIEAGWPEYGRDITEENLPQEVARVERTISFAKGCYVGQETVARIESRGHVNKTLAGLRFETNEVAPPDTPLTAGAVPVGRVTSAAFSPRLGAAVGLGYVRRGHDAPGTKLDSPLGPVEVVSLPMQLGV